MNEYKINPTPDNNLGETDYSNRNADAVDVVKETDYYKTIKSVVDGFVRSPLFKTFAGNCIAASDMVQAALALKGIQARILEVQLSMLRNKENSNDYMFIGFDNVSSTGQVDTHMVVVTDTEIPLLIDLSLGKYLPAELPFILRPVFPDGEMIAEFDHLNIKINYSYKKNIRYPQLHQKYLIQRMQDEKEVRSTITLIKYIVAGALTLAMINFTMNAVLIILKIIYP